MISPNQQINLKTDVILHDGTRCKISEIFVDSNYLVIYFYPKDNTPGCTIQACEFRDSISEFQSRKTQIVGVSKDSPKSHQKFIKDKNLNFAIISDEDKALHEMFDVLVTKKMFGKEYLGTERSSFLINNEGKIIQSWQNVNPKENPTEILKYLDQLN